MRISELIIELEKLKADTGDVEVVLDFDYVCGDYGGHNCTATTDTKWVEFMKDRIVLSGNEI